MSISDELRDAIRRDGRSINRLAHECGVETASISRFLRGERELVSGNVDRLAAALGLTLTSTSTKVRRRKGK